MDWPDLLTDLLAGLADWLPRWAWGLLVGVPPIPALPRRPRGVSLSPVPGYTAREG